MNNILVYISNWLKVCCYLIFLMILVGGATRLTQSGLSMVDWKPLMGIIPPLNERQWDDSFNKYKNYPEYQKINQFNNMNLSKYKSIYYWEYSHRMLGRIIGLAFIIPFLFFYIKKYMTNNLALHLLLATFLVIFQGIIGWFMVKSGLIDNPHVSHYRLALHLFLALILLGYTYYIKLHVDSIKKNKVFNKKTTKHIVVILLFYIIQVLFGAFIAGTKAGLLWNTFPLMEGKLIPEGLFIISPFYLNFFENMKMFQFAHRILGTTLLIYSGWFFIKTNGEYFNKYAGLLFMALMMQFYIGVMTLLLKVPLFFAVLHQGMAAVILLILVHIIYLINNSKFING